MIKQYLKKIYNFLNDDTLYYAGSLSFFTIFSFLPIFALVLFLMSQTQYFKNHIDTISMYILNFVNPAHSDNIVNIINSFLANINKLGDIGIFYLFFVFIMFVKDYDYIVSKIFETKKRNIINAVFIYFFIIVILPMGIVILTLIDTFVKQNLYQDIIHSILSISGLAIIFYFSANTKTNFSKALVASFLVATTLTITKFLFSYFIIYNTTYATIYGTMSIMLFVFLWIYIFWIIYLYGLKLFKVLNDN